VTAAAASLSGLATMHQHFDLPLPGVLRVSAPHFYGGGKPGESEAAFVDRLIVELEELIAREGADTIDEVITGFGRLGQRFGTQVYGLQPDMLTVAKMMTSAYVPMSALFVSESIYNTVAVASAGVGTFGHGYTYSGHPLACAVALETLRIYESDDVVGHVQRVAPRLQAGIQRLGTHPLVGQARGLGLIGAIELAEDPAARKPFDPAQHEAILEVESPAAARTVLQVVRPGFTLHGRLVRAAHVIVSKPAASSAAPETKG
jgi:4-aminobutyrate--pyruvate transaminase